MTQKLDEFLHNPNGVCPLCGSPYLTGSTCEEVFDSLLAQEFSNPEYGTVHFLTVACMMVQHKAYSDPGLEWIYSHLKMYLGGDQTILQIREQNKRSVDAGQRKWKVLRDPCDRELPRINWSMTIQDVVMKYDDTQSYREIVKNWARSVVHEMEPWLIATRSSS